MCDRNEALSVVLNESGCKPLYDALSECLSSNDRDWRKCQTQLLAFRKCYEQKPLPTDEEGKNKNKYNNNNNKAGGASSKAAK
mmetsp:Transcript_38730/g.75212  ORF Transcript_38730/g.75212 Transcript_38730/m.75212 type:complete len:83 (+) Transcript_38730:44-292(+)